MIRGADVTPKMKNGRNGECQIMNTISKLDNRSEMLFRSDNNGDAQTGIID